MNFKESAELVHYTSPFLSLAFAKAFPMIAQFGVESGGRLRRHMEYTLLKPGLGMTSVHQGKASLRRPAKLEHSPDHVSYAAEGEGLDWDVRFVDDRTVAFRLSRRGGKIAPGEFFRMDFATEVAPVTVFGDWIAAPDFPPKKRRESIFDVPESSVDYRVPVLVHFPDYGALKIVSKTQGVFVRQTMRGDATETGLNLGCTNTSYHTGCVTLHRGVMEVSLHAEKELDAVELELSAEPEHYPQIPGIDFSDARWNGLKRCWHNSFTVNPETLSMGDNPVLHGVAHLSIHFKSDVSVFTPPLMEGLTVHKWLGRALRLTFEKCVGPTGEIHNRYATEEGRKRHNGDFGFFDANISNLIALYNYTAATGDWSIAREHADKLRLACEFLMKLDRDGDGILEVPFDGNAFRQDRECRNWWDNFSFGHKDGFLNLLAYRAFGNVAEMMQKMGRDADAKPLNDIRQKFAANFHPTFFNPKTGVHAGWISADGNMHDYMFTFISSMAINEGLVDRELGRKILNTLLEKLRAEGYGDWKWGIPGPLISVSESDEFIWEPMQRWGSYENGGFCGQTAYHFIQALYEVGMREQADEILFRMMDTFEKEFTHSGTFPGYMRSVDWRTKEGIPCGYNYLADNYYFLLAAITGHFGIKMPRV